ncbi:MAG TPA: DUF4397 domain-containing protein [Kineosporiaceae bacterium]|nr:DUF4397 domain-containing protein [Kineosporiaceae bacterium]
MRRGYRGPLRGLIMGPAALVLGIGGALAAAPADAAPGKAEVYLVDGLLGVPVAVVLDGREVVASAPPASVVGPMAIDAGPHVVTLQAGGRTITGARFTVTSGQSIDLVAHRAADSGQVPRIVVFRNDLSPVGPSKARLVVAHAAVAPPADVRLGGTTLFHDVSSGEALSLLVPARSYSVDVVASAGSDTILGPVRLAVRAGTLTRVFAVGDPSNGTADVVVQVLPVPVVGAGRPRSVPTGDGGQAAESYVADGPDLRPPAVAAALALVLLVLLVRGGRGRLVRLHRRRS